MKPLLSSLLLTLCCFAGVAARAAGTPDTQWTYKTINGKALEMDVSLPEGYDLQKAGNASEFYVGKGGKHGFCVGTKEQNRFFYWSLELVDAFLVKHGVLTGENRVLRPGGVEPLQPEEFEAYLCAESRAHRKPNIVFIYADDWGWGDLSCHGHEWLKTPNIDRLASEGIDFQQFNVLNPVCSPSRTAVMTGKYPARFSVHQHFASATANRNRNMPDWLDPKAIMLPRLLKKAGYRTAHFGKWHLTNNFIEGAPRPGAYGYDAFAVFNGGAEWPSAGSHDTAANTVAFIKENKDQPFFINVWLHESHTMHTPRAESMEQWNHLDEKKQVYSAVITDGDQDVGTILDALESQGLADNTIVMFCSDNGPEWTSAKPKPKRLNPETQLTSYGSDFSIGQTGGLRGKKRSLYEGGVRVPFIVRWPGHTPAGVTDTSTVMTAVDLLPTLCAAAAVKLPTDYQGDGENLLAALQGKPITRNAPHFLGMARPQTRTRLVAAVCGARRRLETPDDRGCEARRAPQPEYRSCGRGR